eukprot:c10545_g1_i2.p1 GENE.c10545_g1_i2~~c10545_g1_i2.p1  ORF type:complete len:360 (+),score=78.92 c10545_g1_i2:80-1159(+)
MGGHALKKILCVRKPAHIYEQLKAHVTSLLTSHGMVWVVPSELPGKETYGDLDVLVVSKSEILGKDKTIFNFVREHFAPTEIVSNGPVLSFDITRSPSEHFRNFQIDFIRCENEDELRTAHFYLSYGDVGGILGRIVSACALKLGQKGMWIEVNLNKIDSLIQGTAGLSDFEMTVNTQRLHLSSSPAEICEFLGLDHAQHSRGFTHENEVFQWVAACRYFDPAIFTSLNHAHRHRCVTRPSYQRFLEHVSVDVVSIRHASDKIGEVMLNLQVEAVRHFGKFDELVVMKTRDLERQEIASKFSGNLFRANGFEGAALGAAIIAFKASKPDFESFVRDTPAAVIKEQVDEFCIARRLEDVL